MSECVLLLFIPLIEVVSALEAASSPALVEVPEGGPAARGTIRFGIVWRETLFRAM